MNSFMKRLIKRTYARGIASLHHQDIAQTRLFYLSKSGPKEDFNYKVHKLNNGPLLHIHYPKDYKGPLPVVVFIRGSGFCIGEILTADRFCHWLCSIFNCVAISLEHRLAPEFPFPIPFEDCLTGIDYIQNNSKQLNIDLERMAIIGDSSGGGLSCAIVHHQAAQDEKIFKHHIAISPSLDLSNRSYVSKERLKKGYLVDGELIQYFIQQYLGNTKQHKNWKASPVYVSSYEGVAPTTIIIGELDPVLDENSYYFHQALLSGLDIRMVVFREMIHGFIWYYRFVPEARLAAQLLLDTLSEALVLPQVDLASQERRVALLEGDLL